MANVGDNTLFVVLYYWWNWRFDCSRHDKKAVILKHNRESRERGRGGIDGGSSTADEEPQGSFHKGLYPCCLHYHGHLRNPFYADQKFSHTRRPQSVLGKNGYLGSLGVYADLCYWGMLVHPRLSPDRIGCGYFRRLLWVSVCICRGHGRG